MQHPFSGFAIGGLSVGEPLDALEDMTAANSFAQR